MDSVWGDGEYLATVGQKLGLSQEKILQYINSGVLELSTSGKINMQNARKRINKHYEEGWKDEATAQANVALFNLHSKTGSAILNTESHYDFERDAKVQTVRQLIVKGGTQFQVLQFLIQKQGLTYNEAMKLYQETIASFRMTKGIDREYEVAKIYARFEMLFAQAQENKDYQSTLVIQREFINFFNIKAPPPQEPEKTREQIESEGGVVRPAVYIPDNGRDPDFVNNDGVDPNAD